MMAESRAKRIDTEQYVEGYATTFNDPYVLFEYDGVKYVEEIDRHALDDADMTDVILQYNHEGRVFARQSNGSLLLDTDDHGFFVAADLSRTENARNLYEDISTGMVNQMSWGFIVDDDMYIETKTEVKRTILKVRKVYDVSAVSIPANPGTEINTRAWVDGAVYRAKQEKLKRDKLMLLLKLEGF